MKMEDHLREALRRVEAPEGFADRVIAQLPPRVAGFRQASPRRNLRWAWAAAAAAVLVLAFSVSVQYRHIQQRRAAEQAVQALQIVADELNMAQNEVLNQ